MVLLNLIWFIFGGEIVALLWLVLAALFSITVIGIPIGKEIIRETELKGENNVSKARKIGGLVLNIVWFPIGLVLAVVYVVMAVVSFITIVGIPAGVVQAKTAKFVLFPIGAKCVSKKQAYASAVANELERRQNS